MPEGPRTESSAVASSRRRLIGGSGARAHRRVPVRPKRSVLMRSRCCPEAVRSSATCSTNDVRPHASAGQRISSLVGEFEHAGWEGLYLFMVPVSTGGEQAPMLVLAVSP